MSTTSARSRRQLTPLRRRVHVRRAVMRRMRRRGSPSTDRRGRFRPCEVREKRSRARQFQVDQYVPELAVAIGERRVPKEELELVLFGTGVRESSAASFESNLGRGSLTTGSSSLTGMNFTVILDSCLRFCV